MSELCDSLNRMEELHNAMDGLQQLFFPGEITEEGRENLGLLFGFLITAYREALEKAWAARLVEMETDPAKKKAVAETLKAMASEGGQAAQ